MPLNFRIATRQFYAVSSAGTMGQGEEPFYSGSQHIDIMPRTIRHFQSIRNTSSCIDSSCRCRQVLRVLAISAHLCLSLANDSRIHCIHKSAGSRVLQPESIRNISSCSQISCNCTSSPSGRSWCPRLFLPTTQRSQIPRGSMPGHRERRCSSGSIRRTRTLRPESARWESIFNRYAHELQLINQKAGLRVFFLALKSATSRSSVQSLSPRKEHCQGNHGQQSYGQNDSFELINYINTPFTRIQRASQKYKSPVNPHFSQSTLQATPRPPSSTPPPSNRSNYHYFWLYLLHYCFRQRQAKIFPCTCFPLLPRMKMSLIIELLKQTNSIHHSSEQDYQYSPILYYKQRAYIFVKLKKQLQNRIVQFRDGQNYYSSHRIFSFSQKELQSLSGIFIQMGQNSLQQAEKYRFIGFCIESYPFITQKELVLGPLLYGDSVFEIYQEHTKRRIISNCFILNNEVFYFINNEQDEQKFPLSQIRQSKSGKTCGIKILFGGINVCVAMQYILEGIRPYLRVKKDIKGNLEKVVYVRYQSSHCSGLLIGKDRVVTVRHIFSSIPQENAVVYVRIYPYLKERKAKIQHLPKLNIDLITFKLIHEGQEDRFINDRCSQQQQTILFDKQPQKLHQGQGIYCMGFGKYSYNNFMFSKFDLVLPTITEGIISKVIDFSGEEVYFKTDSFIYNGYSGTPIWSNQEWIGLSIFILKNSNNSIKFPRHNFSYSSKFIKNYLITPTLPDSTPTLESSLTLFQTIQTRQHLVPRL